MKKLLVAFLIALLGLTVPLSGQTQQAQTTITEPVSSVTQTILTVASATGINADSTLLLGQELMDVVSVSSLRVTVIRGRMGTVPSQHADNAKVKVLRPGTIYTVARVGPCTLGTGEAAFQPIAAVINSSFVILQACRSSTWMATSFLPITFNSVLDTP